MEVPGICFVDGVDPDQEMVELASDNHTMLMVSPVGVFETCGLIYHNLLPSRTATEERGASS